ncbi:fungal-specific transcription factor domain-containing protein [Aspergillus pseudoustus]|uniref:Fungal-specific transcription factor domain-containing protein n=1 Tax=Aspergillus pseudoustus TaxID=1810923 RepID=A0ABR4KUN9_9EURO
MDSISTPVACLNCREKHLKCDGNTDGCVRCMSLSQPCYFIPSRRGRKTRPGPLPSRPVDVPGNSSSPGLVYASIPTTIDMDDSANLSLNIVAPPSPQQQANLHLTSLYYSHFHGAHPFLPSMPVFLQSTPPKYLIEAVEVVGSQYIATHICRDRVDSLISSTDESNLSVEKVQAYLLLSVFSHGHQDPDKARACITRAVHGSLELGMHRREFSDAIGIENAVRAESVRRTWWEIFVVETTLAAMQVNGCIQFNMIENSDVPLPCEEDEYTDSRVDRPQNTLHNLQAEFLPHNDGEFSSLAYRIDAAGMLRNSLIMAEVPSSQHELDLLDTSIIAWYHRIPRPKRSIIGNTGEVDQVLFQAHMLMHCASIYLHYPKSYLLAFLPSAREIFCPRFPTLSTSSANPEIHTAKVVSGAIGLSKLAALSTSVINHSPFVACTLVLSSVIQLAVLSVDWLPPFGADTRFLSLNVGVLNSLGDAWPIAGNSMMRIREMTREVQTSRAAEDSIVPLDTLVV